jgi:hypothetical protein
MMDIVSVLEKQAKEIELQDISGWGNTMLAAADRIRELEAERQQVRETLACGPENLVEWAEKVMRSVRIMEAELAKTEEDVRAFIRKAEKAEEELAALRQQQGEPTEGNWIAADDYYRNVKALDEALNGSGAAERPLLTDVLRQVQSEVRKLGMPLLEAIKHQGEPVAWMCEWSGDESDLCHTVFTDDPSDLNDDNVWEPLYREAAPQVPEGWLSIAIAALSALENVRVDGWEPQARYDERERVKAELRNIIDAAGEYKGNE